MRNIAVVGCAIYVQSACKRVSESLPKNRGLQRTGCYPLVCTDVLCAKHKLRPTGGLLDRRATRDDKPDGLLEPTLDLRAHCVVEYDTCVERDDLHRHVRAAVLLWPLPCQRRVGPRLVRLGIWHVRLG